MLEPAAKGIRPIWLASYPRSGNTFLRIILQNIFRLPTCSIYHVEGQNFLDPSAETLDGAPTLPSHWQEMISDNPDSPPTLIKTHDPPTDCSPAIYLVRDGRAAIDSYFHYHKKFAYDQPSLTEVIAGACQFGTWSAHYLAWNPRTRPNTLFLQYEDLVARPEEMVPRLADFLNRSPVHGRLPTFDELQRQHPAFFRRGKNEDFSTGWTPGQMALFNSLHGNVMEELGYPLSSAPVLPAGTIQDLAHSADRLHKLYLEHLAKLGASWTRCQQLEEAAKRLELAEAQLGERNRDLQRLLGRSWVKLGMLLGAVERPAAKDDLNPTRPAESKHPGLTQTA